MKLAFWCSQCYVDALAAAEEQEAVQRAALHGLRDAIRWTEARARRIRTNLRDRDRDICELSARRRARGAAAQSPLATDETQQLRTLLSRRRMFAGQAARIESVVFQIEQQLCALENSMTMRDALVAMRAGQAAHRAVLPRVADVEQLAQCLADDMATATDMQAALDDASGVQQMDDDELLAELNALLDTERIGDQFVAAASAAATNMPAVPQDTPLAATPQAIAKTSSGVGMEQLMFA